MRIRRLSTVSIHRQKILYSGTLQLPKTSFGPKIPKGPERDELLLQVSLNLYHWQNSRPHHKKQFLLHDGPPYANGDLHLGHALNKILKDIINRWQLLYHGAKVVYTPGWDCHGLPIEMKATSKENLTSVETRQRCRELAQLMIERQHLQFYEFGLMADLNNPYVTMDHEYEVNQLRVFVKLMENGLLSRQLKPVWWGCETKTALAEAELEYHQHKSVAIYVKFELDEMLQQKFSTKIKVTGPVKLLIWTSTPWTIPANKAICVHQDLEYTLIKNDTENLVVAVELADSIVNLDNSYQKTNIVLKGSDLLGLTYTSAAGGTDEKFPVLHGDHVASNAGSGLVHTAPAHGGEDFAIGRTHGLDTRSSVDEEGRFIRENIPAGFELLHQLKVTAKDGIWSTISLLDANKMLFHVDKKFVHSYPYDWRSKTPVIQRATPQWFVDVGKIKETAIAALEKVQFIPQSGKNRLPSFIANRNEWCISRQRTWGVPLPIVYHKSTGDAIEDVETVKYIVERISEYGTDQWFTPEENIQRWLPSTVDGSAYTKGRDTMDVWFDSGTSWTTIENQVSSKPLADVYLEGSDQHRGWFQSSLLNRIIASGDGRGHFEPVAPFEKIITHGFTLDAQNDKMSKSKGNTISPKQVIEGGGKPFCPPLGPDGLRLWVSSSNYTQDVSVSTEILNRVFENVKKLRVTLKFLLGNLQHFDLVHALSYDQLNPLDQYVLSRLVSFQQLVVESYDTFNFQKVVRLLNTHMSSELSSMYFDISKDCLYTDAADSHDRRSIQTVLHYLLKTYIGVLAPIQPLLTQEVWNHYREMFGDESDSPFKKEWDFFKLPAEFKNESVEAEFDTIWTVRDALYKHLEQLRLEGKFKNKLEVAVEMTANDVFEKHARFLDNYFLVSKVDLGEVSEPSFISDSVKVKVVESARHKCPRCWKHIAEVEDELCGKCSSVVNSK